MPHTARVIESTAVADGAIAVKVRCCDDPNTDSVLTIYNLHELDTEELLRQTNGHISDVEQKHLAMQRALAAIQQLMS